MIEEPDFSFSSNPVIDPAYAAYTKNWKYPSHSLRLKANMPGQ
jgi:hypothetical protein